LFNLYESILSKREHYRQLKCGESLITIFNCPLDNKYQDIWSHYNYIVYVIEGRKIWHTAHGSYDLQKGSCVFVRKGACIVEQFLEVRICMVFFFLPDEFICDVLKRKSKPLFKETRKFDPIMPVNNTPAVEAFYHSMMPYFDSGHEPDQALLELKFRELVLTLADNHANEELLSYFCSLLKEPQSISLQRVMEENFSFNLKLEEFARLSARSLSAFKRDFQRMYNASPGKWLMEKRLNHAMHLITRLRKTVSEAAFESGFESPSHFSRSFREKFGRSPTSLKQETST
jgi:AraC-like DNA-binding protein